MHNLQQNLKTLHSLFDSITKVESTNGLEAVRQIGRMSIRGVGVMTEVDANDPDIPILAKVYLEAEEILSGNSEPGYEAVRDLKLRSTKGFVKFLSKYDNINNTKSQ